MVVLAAALFLACGQIQPPPVLEHAPASALTFAIELEDVSRFDGSRISITQVEVTVTVFSHGHAVTLSSQQKLWCNGVPFSKPSYGEMAVPVDRQPVGGSYVFVYTDEQGHRTTFSVPAIAPVTFISLAPGAAVAIPLPVTSVPTPAPQTIPPGSRAPNLDHTPLTIRYALPSLPPGAVARVSMWAECTASGKLGGCGGVDGPSDELPTGTYRISDATTGYGYGFETFVPGPGYIEASLQIIWYPATAFASVKITYGESLTELPIRWTAK